MVRKRTTLWLLAAGRLHRGDLATDPGGFGAGICHRAREPPGLDAASLSQRAHAAPGTRWLQRRTAVAGRTRWLRGVRPRRWDRVCGQHFEPCGATAARGTAAVERPGDRGWTVARRRRGMAG